MIAFKNYDGKNHNYGKLVDGVLELSPASLIVGDKQYIGNDSTRYANAGYFPIIYADKPEDTDTGHYEPVYTETDGQIVQAWEFVSDISHGMIDTSIIKVWSNWFEHGARIETADFINTSGGEYFESMFEGFIYPSYPDVSTTPEKLNEILARLNISNGVIFSRFCAGNSGIREITTSLDTTKGRYFNSAFRECKTLLNAPSMNTSSGIEFTHMFYYCTAMVNGGVFDLRKILKTKNDLSAQYMFANCTSMTKVTIKTDKLYSSNMVRMFYQCSALTDLTIEGTIKVDDNSLNVAYSPNLSMASAESVINALEDNTSETNTYVIYFPTAVKNNLLNNSEYSLLYERLIGKNFNLG